MSEQEKKVNLIKELNHLDKEKDNIEFHLIPGILKKLAQLNLSDEEIRENGLDAFDEWKHLHS